MSETATNNQMPGGQTDQAGHETELNETHETGANGLDLMYDATQSPADVGAQPGDTAREVAARHIGRLLYAPVNTWSRYVFHENDPHPFAPARPTPGRA